MSAIVSVFFAPANPKRPANFIVIKYFLLGLLISNAIESILIIPKILDVMDQNIIQEKKIEKANIERQEIKMLVADRERQQKAIETVEHQEFKELLEERAGEHHHGQGSEHFIHVEVRKRPQKEDSGTNPVAVFMLFYGAVTLCLGIVALFKEKATLIAILIGVSILGIVILVSAGFSILMLLSVSKDCLIAGLSYKYREMIVASDLLVAGEAVGAAGVADYSQAQQPTMYPGQQQMQ